MLFIVSRVEEGEKMIICDRDIPIAKLVTFQHCDRRSSLGRDRGKFTVPDDFNDPLPEEILTTFEGNIP